MGEPDEWHWGSRVLWWGTLGLPVTLLRLALAAVLLASILVLVGSPAVALGTFFALRGPIGTWGAIGVAVFVLSALLLVAHRLFRD